MYTSYPQTHTRKKGGKKSLKFFDEVNQEATADSEAPDEEALVSPAKFFSLRAPQVVEDPDSETSPISKVSGRVSEDSTVYICKREESSVHEYQKRVKEYIFQTIHQLLQKST